METDYATILQVIGSPLRFFGLTAIVCSTAFSIGAGILKNERAFVYCIHMFLAIIGLFAAIAVWCPRSLYHPTELTNLGNQLPPNSPYPVALISIIVLAIYIVYKLYAIHINKAAAKQQP